jgi:predicted dehydrogenase
LEFNMKENQTVSVAFVGAGSMAGEHARAFASIPGVVLSGITSRTRSRAQALAERHGIAHVADSVEELYERTHADLLVVTVPELSANAVAKAALRLPWAILMEKPAGYDLADARDIAAAASDHAAPVMVALNRRFYSSMLAVQADLAARPSEHRFIHVQDQQSFAEARHHKHPEAVVQKFMYANSIHLIDMIAALGRGRVSRINRVAPWRGEETEVVLAHVEFDSGDTALYEGLWRGPGPWACAISTPSRRWTLQPLEQATYQNAGERARHTIEASEDDRNFKPGFLLQARAAVASLRGEASPILSLQDSLATMELINGIFGV